MKKVLLPLALFLTICCTYAQPNVPVPSYHLVQTQDWVQTKNYYLLTLFEQDKEVSKLLANDADLAKLTSNKLNALQASFNCKEVTCFTENIKFTDAEIKTVSNRLTQLYQPDNALGRLVKTHLIPSGTYILNRDLSAAQLLAKAWEQDAAGINYTIDVYAGGKKPNYPQIDSISFNIKDKRYPTLLYDAVTVLQGDLKKTGLFFEPALHAALLYLQMNGRQDASADEPMTLTVNKAAADRVKNIKWNNYKYTLILVPGAGGEDLTTALSAEGMLRCRLAVQQYQKGAAPFILVSGGKVHPYKTKYCEAEEMKKYMLETLHVPEDVILIDPHARHTTTNIRNGARLIFRYKMPFDKPCLTVTDKSQTDYIMNMAGRCEKELKYVPYKLGSRISDTSLEFYPLIQSLQINPYEPLDP